MFDYQLEPGKSCQKKSFHKVSEPLVTIITPFYNGGEYFEQTYNSVANQTFPWFEWIIVDDGSTQKEGIELLSKLAKQDNRISVYRQENAGPSRARNLAIEKSISNIIIPLDADDLIVPTYVECLYWTLMHNDSYDWSYTDSIGFGTHQYLWRQTFDSERLKTFNYLVYSGAIRKEALIEVGGYDESEKHCYEDWHLWLKLVKANKRPIKVSMYGFWYRRHDSGNLTKVESNLDLKDKAKEMIEKEATQIKGQVIGKTYPLVDASVSYRKLDTKPRFPYRSLEALPKKSIMFIFPWMEMGGADLFNLQLIEGLRLKGYHICVVTTLSCEDPWRQRYEALIDDVFSLPTFLEKRDYLTFIDYLIQTRKVTNVCVSNAYFGYYILPWLRMTYENMTIVDYVHMEEWYFKDGGYARTSFAFQQFIDKTLTCNEQTKNVLTNHFGVAPKKVQTLYIGTDIAKNNLDINNKENVRHQYNIPMNKKIILFPCRLHPQKRPFLMAQIALRLKKKRSDFVVLVVGDGVLSEQLKDYVAMEGIAEEVIFAGEQKQMAPFYSGSYITLVCSIKEGLSLTAYESLAMGVPIISADVGGQKELIDESVGRLIPLEQDEEKDLNNRNYNESEINAYVNAITQLLDDEASRERLSNTACQKIASHYTTDKMVEGFEKVVEGLKSENMEAKHQVIRQSLELTRDYVEDSLLSYIIQSQYEDKVNHLWKERNWYYGQYQNSIKGSDSIRKRVYRRLYNRLRPIWVKRLKYTKLGKMIRKLLKR